MVLTTSTLVTTNLKALQRVSYIRYPIQFQNYKVQALIDSGSKVNAMISVYVAELGLVTQKTSIRAQKIDGLPLKTYSMALTRFSV